MERSSPQRFDEELARRIRRIESTLADLRSSSMVRMVTHTHDESQIEAHSTPNLIAEGGSEGLEGELTLTTGANENRVYIDAFWDSVANAKGYEVELLTPDVVTETTGPDGETHVVTENVIVQRNSTESTHIRFDPVEPLTDYVVKVRVIYSNLATPADYLTGTITTGKDETVPEQVTGLSIGEGYKTITATWNEVADSDVRDGNGQYEIAIATNSEFTEGLRSQRVGGTVASFGDLTPGEALYVRVRAVDSSGNLGPWSAVETATPGDVVPPDPSPSDGVPPASSPAPSVSAGIGFLVAEWQPVENADPITYHVHISTTSGFTPNAGTKHGEINGTTYFIHSTAGGNALVAGTTYYVKIIATDADGAASPSAQGSGVPAAMPEEFELSAGSILEEHLANSAVASAKLKDGAVTTDKITADWLVGSNLVIGGTGTTYVTTDHDPTTKATPGDVNTARQEAIDEAAADATTKASAAQSAAEQAAALDAQAKADQAEADAKAAAAIDAQSRAEAEAAQAKADATAEAAADAQTKANAAQAAAIAAAEAYADAAVQPANDRITLWQHADTTFIDGGRVFADSVTANQIAAGAIGVNELAANSVNASKMVTGTITAASGILADAVITTAKIADLNVTTAKIANLNVTEGKIANLAVTTAKVQDAAITNAKIGNLAVDSAKIADAAITTVKIGDAQITNAKIVTLAANKLTTDTLTATTITLGTGGILRAGNTTDGLYFDETGLKMFKGGATTVDLPVGGDPMFTGAVVGGSLETALGPNNARVRTLLGRIDLEHWNGTQHVAVGNIFGGDAVHNRRILRISGGSATSGTGGQINYYGNNDPINPGRVIISDVGSTGSFAFGTMGGIGSQDCRAYGLLQVDGNLTALAGQNDPASVTQRVSINGPDGWIIARRSSATALFVGRAGATSDGNVVGIYRGTALVGTIAVSAGATAYNTTSDHRLKTNVVDLPVTESLARIQAARPVKFNWAASRGGGESIGYLAHELASVMPWAVTGARDAVDANGNPEYQGVDYSKLVVDIQAVLRHVLTRIENVEKKLGV